MTDMNPRRKASPVYITPTSKAPAHLDRALVMTYKPEP